MVKLLLKDPRADVRALSKEGWSALHYAAFEGHVEVVKLLLGDPRVEVRAVDENGWSALHFAAGDGHVEVVNLLLEDPRVDANARTNNYKTPLHLAASKNHHKVVRLLLDSPQLSTANCVDNIDQWSPVMTALKTESKDALEELLNHPKVSLGTIDGTGRNLEMVARWVLCNQIEI